MKKQNFHFTKEEKRKIDGVLCFLQYPLINKNKEWTRDWVLKRIEYFLVSTRGGLSLPPHADTKKIRTRLKTK